MANIFSVLNPDDIVQGNATIVTLGLWSGDTGSLSSFFTSSVQTATTAGGNFEYYVNAYQLNPDINDSAEIQFSVAYGHISGGGAPTLIEQDNATLSTTAIYDQYKNILLGQSTGKFSFNGVPEDHIYIINVQRARLKERLDPGNWILTLSGSNGIRTFIDDSSQTLQDAATFTVSGQAFNVVSGSLGSSGNVATISAISGSDGSGFGLMYPERGIIILNPNALIPVVGFSGSAGGAGTLENMYYSNGLQSPFAPFTGSLTGGNASKHQRNHMGLFYSIVKGADFQARSAETLSSTHYFIRLKNREFNFSNNPSLKNPTDGTILITDFVKSPKTYVTTVGLYNDTNELLAVAKLSRPIEKSGDKEALLRVRLDF